MSYIGNTSTTQSFTPAVDYFSGNGSTTAFTLSRPVASVAQVQVTVANVPQNPTSAYTISGQTLTFTSAPPSGTNNIYVYYTSPITQVIAPGQGTVTATSMASSTGSGSVVLATSPTITSPTITGAVISSMASSVITSGTAVASTSGTSIDFTSIPSWVKRVTVMLSGVSTSGTSNWLFQLGSGSVTTTGYLSVGARFSNATAVATTSYTNGLGIYNDSAGAVVGGICTFTLLGSNAWTATAVLSRSDSSSIYTSGMTITLGGTLDRIRITTVNGTDTFDAGSINILYE